MNDVRSDISPLETEVLVREIGWRDPVDAFAPLADAPYSALLDSAAAGDPRSEFSYIAVEPFRILSFQKGKSYLDGVPVAERPFDILQAELGRFRLMPQDLPAPFTGGAIGFIGYEMANEFESLEQRHSNDLDIPDMVFALYDVLIAFSHLEKRAWVLSSGLPENDMVQRQARATRRAEQIVSQLGTSIAQFPAQDRSGNWRAEVSRTEYEMQVAKILDYIRAGDIFQANFTSRFIAPRPPGLSAFAMHCLLRQCSSAPFSAFLNCGPRLSIASASPERFLRLHPDGQIESRPIKGTRPRGGTARDDADLAAELAASVKDRAENLMIVDLMRNDIGRVAQIGSVSVPSLFMVERFASVLHLVSSVTGRLAPGISAVGLLRSTFPPGSVTGAPKIRAMEIIDELEAGRRGPYCGTIAWIGFDGAMDSSVVIRSLIVTPEMVVAQAGGGIVADSDSVAEFNEMMLKLGPLLQVLEGKT